MDIKYDDKYHLHLGYYENNCDYESIAYKRLSEDVWDVFFDIEQYGLEKTIEVNELSLEGIGTRIFSISGNDLTYETGVKRFEEWLAMQKII
ncbi:DUF3986 family protein [Rossellomorea yichunensis]|uniref:DUF3986 family protein n=1 Tax=Rossellomorea yichunensis TaxID=3077331 RepID=UPI0028DF9CCB|nr:DUF3986 family protein [Rossellomorea sp. YC4-1]MDT9027309.1 DUF3986 family protein [Rossellomorea sp. YC4-1]